jgi:hypothetical protein
MPKRISKTTKNRSPHDEYGLPAEIDFSKLKFIGFGVDALERHIAKQSTTVVLDSDVAKVFGTSESVNTVLRGIIQSLLVAGKRKKSA